jgi:hypothetical protein
VTRFSFGSVIAPDLICFVQELAFFPGVDFWLSEFLVRLITTHEQAVLAQAVVFHFHSRSHLKCLTTCSQGGKRPYQTLFKCEFLLVDFRSCF